MRLYCFALVFSAALLAAGIPCAGAQPASQNEDPCVVALKKLHGPLKKYFDTMGEMPKDLNELSILGFVDSPLALVSPRSLSARAPKAQVADYTTWRIASKKFEGWILVSDEVRDGCIFGLHADGIAQRFTLEWEFWYGRWTVPEEVKHAKGDVNGRTIAGLNLILQEVPTNIFRPAIILRGYVRHDTISGDLRSEDRILNVGGHQVTTLAELEEFIRSHPDVKWTEIPIEVIRKGRTLQIGLGDSADSVLSAPGSLYPNPTKGKARTGSGSSVSGESGGQAKPRRRGTPSPELIKAANKGKLEEVRKLLREGADPDSRDDRGFTPLIMAVYRGHMDIVKELLAAKADINAFGARGENALLAAVDGEHLELFRLLAENGASKEYRNDEGGTILAAACHSGNVTFIRAALALGIDVNVKQCYREGRRWNATGLMIAASTGQVAAVAFLLREGAEVDYVGQEGYTALMITAAEGKDEVLSILLGAGADPNRKNDEGKTALDLAREEKEKKIIRILDAVTEQ